MSMPSQQTLHSTGDHHTSHEQPHLLGRQVRARFVERFSMGAPYSGGEVRGPAFSDVTEKVDWVEKFVRLGTKATEAARSEHDLCALFPSLTAPSKSPQTNPFLRCEVSSDLLAWESRPQCRAPSVMIWVPPSCMRCSC